MFNRTARLNRSQIETLLFIRQCENSLFSEAPNDVFLKICGYDLKENWQDYASALNYVVNGDLESLATLLKAKPFLVLCKGLPENPLITPAGLVIHDINITILECALGAGDPEIAEIIKPYFLLFKNGEEKMKRQLERYRLCIDAIMTQKPFDLAPLINILIDSSLADVAAELATLDDYDPHHESNLRAALIQFRNDLKPGILTAPRMHCNYQNLQYAFDIFNHEWNNLMVGSNYEKVRLFWSQIIGVIELQELPFYERAAFVSGQVKEIGTGQPLKNRSTLYEITLGKFSSNNFSLDMHMGLSIDHAVDLYGFSIEDLRPVTAERRARDFENLCRAKMTTLQNLCASASPTPTSMIVYK